MVSIASHFLYRHRLKRSRLVGPEGSSGKDSTRMPSVGKGHVKHILVLDPETEAGKGVVSRE